MSYPLNQEEGAWVVATFFLVTVVSIPPWNFCADFIGRKKTLLLAAIPIIVSCVTSALATSLPWFLLARGIFGFANGAIISVLIVYLEEIGGVKNRWRLLVFYNNFFTLGVLLSYVLGTFLSIAVFNYVVLVIPIAFLCLFTVFGIETPIYLLKHNENDKAYEMLKKLRNCPDRQIQIELVELTNQIRPKNLISDVKILKAFAVIALLAVFQQFSGINVVLSYAENIFKVARFNNDHADIYAMTIVGVILFVTSFFAHCFSKQQKDLFVISISGISVGQCLVGVYFHMDANTINGADYLWFLLVCGLGLFITSYNCIFVLLPYTVIGEIFPDYLRSNVIAVVGIIGYTIAFALTVLYQIAIREEWIVYATWFWIFTGCSCLCVIFVIIFVPTIKNRILGETYRELETSQ